jgi:hypothetical protein
MNRHNPAPDYCATCWIETGECSPAVKWDGVPLCREHLAENQMKCEGIAPYPVDVIIDAPAMLQ